MADLHTLGVFLSIESIASIPLTYSQENVVKRDLRKGIRNSNEFCTPKQIFRRVTDKLEKTE